MHHQTQILVLGSDGAGRLALEETLTRLGYVVLGIVTVVTMAAINITRGRIGRIWKSVRDMDIAAELVGINLMKAKLSAFFVSSYIVGISGALFVFLWRGAAEPNLFDIPLSFRVLFIAIKGINRLKREEPAAAPAEPTAEVKLLTEIRDLLRR